MVQTLRAVTPVAGKPLAVFPSVLLELFQQGDD